MIRSTTFTIPFPPSVNQYWRTRVFAGAKPFASQYISPRGRAYRDEVAAAVLSHFGRIRPVTSRLRVTLHVFAPDKRKRDLDNLAKAPLDALTHAGVWGDDSQIDRLEIVREAITTPGHLIVTVEQL